MPDLLERFSSRERSKQHVFWGLHILNVYQDQSNVGCTKGSEDMRTRYIRRLSIKRLDISRSPFYFSAINHGHFGFWNEADMACCGSIIS
jgi:hypothetical protein